MSDLAYDFRREYLLRLALPLAQLYSRAYNAKDARSRHDNAFYLCEALVKLTTAPAAACYLAEVEQGAPRVPTLDRALAQLALPSLGQWVGMLRELARHFGARVDAPSHPLGRLFAKLDEVRGDRPALTALYRRIKNGPDGAPAGDQTVSLLQLFDALVQYRNGVFGHGAGRFETFYEQELGPLLFPAVNELLSEGVLEPLGPTGSRLAYITELRTLDDGRTQVGLRELVGLQGERTAPLELAAEQAKDLLPNRVVVLWPGRTTPLRLDPLLQYRESELAEEVLFLNRDRNGRQVEYLSYTTGRTERDKSMLPAMAALLSRVTNHTVAEADLEKLAEQSLAETPSLEALFAQSPPAGRLVGDYELLAELGRGGMGVVYLAKQLSLGRLVALKMLPTDLAADDVALARFRREIRHLARCDHPNIVKVLGSGTLPDGRLYYAMEYVPGSDLGHVWRELSEVHKAGGSTTLGNSTWARAVWNAGRKRRERTESSQGGVQRDPAATVPARSVLPLPPLPAQPLLPDAADDPGGYVRRVVALVRDTALALQTVHEQGIVHRDVSPDNLMLTPDGSRVVLMDFGLAKGQTQMARSISEPGGFVGKLRYAAPEQLAAAKLKVGPQADVRALGVTLWELLTRKRLFAEADDEAALAVAVHDHDVPQLRSIDPTFDRDLEAIVARACERRQADRIQSAAQLAEYLQLYLDQKPLPIRTPSLGELAKRWVREHKTQAASIAAATLVIVCVTATAFALINGARHGAVTAKEDAIAAKDDAVTAKNDAIEARNGESEKLKALTRETAKLTFHQGNTEWDAGRLQNGTRQMYRAYQLAQKDDPFRQSYLRVLLDRLQMDRAVTFRHEDSVLAAAFSPDGTRVVTGSDDKAARIWDAATGQPLGEPLRHESYVKVVAFSPDGTRIVTGSWDKTARLWDAATGKPLGEPLRHESYVKAVAFSPDGTQVVTGSDDKTARLWDAATGQPLGEPLGHEDIVKAVAFSPDGMRIVTGSQDKTARLWDAATGKPLGEPLRHEESVVAVAFSPDGMRVVTGSWDETARLWDAASGKPLGEPLRHENFVVAVAFSPDGTRLVTGSWDKTARLWDVATGQPLGEPLRHEEAVDAVAFSPDGTRVVTGSGDKTARLWDSATGKPLGEPLRHEGSVYAVSFSRDGTRVVTASQDKTARLWVAATGQSVGEALRHVDSVFAVAFSPDGTRVVTGSGDQTARLWDSATGQPLGEPLRHENRVSVVAFSPDGTRFVTGSWDQTARLWDVATGQPLGEPLRHEGSVTAAAFSPDGTRVLTGSLDQTARLWDASTGKPLGEPLRHEAEVEVVAFSPDGTRFVTGSFDKTARLWDAATGKPLGESLRHEDVVYAVAFSPDGTRVVTGSLDQTARLWDATTGKPLGEPLRHENAVTAVAFSPDGTRVVTSAGDKTARLWDAATGKPLGEPLRHEGSVTAVAFSPDGTRIVTGSADNTARLWDAATGKPLGDPLRHEDRVYAVAFSPDGTRVVTGSWDKTARLWDVRRAPQPNEAWIERHLGGVVDKQGDFQAFSSAEFEGREKSLSSDGDWLAEFRAFRESIMRNAQEQLAREALEKRNWFAARFHLQRLAELEPTTEEWKTLLKQVADGEVEQRTEEMSSATP